MAIYITAVICDHVIEQSSFAVECIISTDGD